VPRLKPPQKKILFVFFDGVGLAQRTRRLNPFQFLPSKFFSFRRRKIFPEFRGFGKAIDATLGVGGLPQSATGQASILSGVNAPRLLGRHLNGFPNRELRELLSRESVFVKLKERGLDATFANAYQPEFFTLPLAKHYVSVSTAAVTAAGIPLNDIGAVAMGRALYQEFTNSYLNARGFSLDVHTPEQAGEILVNISLCHDFTFYEYFLSDLVGHRRSFDRALIEVSKLDRLLTGVCARFNFDSHTLLVTSDHGNLEDPATKSHTRNPVPLLAFGHDARFFTKKVRTLADITPAILGFFDR
jgi:2,3-bisphosphoglycerate-independent phosphoglycerate mutase